MDLDTPESRPASWLVAYVGLAAAAICIVTIAVVLSRSASIFPTAISDDLESAFLSNGSTQAEAVGKIIAIRTHALAALAANGVRSGIVLGPVQSGLDRSAREYWASQLMKVHADDYPRYARLANRINRLKDRDFGLSFPVVPFQSYLIGLLVAAFALAVVSMVSLETRRSDVSRSPRGMHPVVMVTQTLMYGIIITLAIAYVKLLGDGIAGAFAFVEGLFIASLAVWLYQTRRSWTQSVGYRIAYYGYVAALLIATGVVVWATVQPVV